MALSSAGKSSNNYAKETLKMEEPTISSEIWQTIQALNRAWTAEGNAEALRNYFHETMVAINATDRNRLEGREACVASWKAFTEATRILSWEEIDPKIQLYGNGNFAVVTYYFDICFEMGEQMIRSSGRDMFVLVKEDGKWWVVADQFSAYPS